MFPEYADEYREMVQLCWAFAAAASHAEAKSARLSLAKRWQRLAEEAQRLAEQNLQEKPEYPRS
jgi:hypothetical protein